MERIRSQFDRTLDLMGIGLSGLCLAQCLLLPVAATAMPALTASVFSDEVFHQLLAWFVLPVSVLAFTVGCWRHRHYSVLLPATLGVVSILTAVLWGHDGPLGDVGARVLTLIGAGLLATGHWVNYRLCRRPEVCSDHTG